MTLDHHLIPALSLPFYSFSISIFFFFFFHLFRNSPTFPDHAWWSPIVDQAGGAIIGTIANGARGIVVEDPTTNCICTMDLTSTSPASREMPHEGDNCGAWISATPHLIHRQDRKKMFSLFFWTILFSRFDGPLTLISVFLYLLLYVINILGSNVGKTILHRLCEDNGALESLESYLDSVPYVA